MTPPLVSIIVPAYNAGKFLRQTLESAIAQSAESWELIVVNDGSTDDTPDIAEQFANLDGRISVVHQDNCGLAKTRNRGMTYISARSEAVCFLDADDVLCPDAVQVLTTQLANCPEATAAYGLACFTNSAGNIFRAGEAEQFTVDRREVVEGRLVMPEHDKPTTFAMLVYRNFIWSPGQVLIRKAALDMTGPFNADISPTADWDVWLRLALRGNLSFVNHVVLEYRRHDSNMSGNMQIMRDAELTMRRNLLNSLPIHSDERRTALAGYYLSEKYGAFQALFLAKQCFGQRHLLTGIKYLRRVVMHSARAILGVPI